MDYGFSIIDIPNSFCSQQMEQAYKLSNGTILFPSEQDPEGYYWGAVGMDGMYLRTGVRYYPICSDRHQIVAFRKILPLNSSSYGLKA